MSDLPDIEFDGKLVKPKGGKYKCPFSCHPKNGYPAPSWKSVAGFTNHMSKCTCSPSGQKRKAAEAEARAADNAQKAEAAAAQLGLAIGDQIFYSTYTVSAPTHVQRGDRMVRVRYEELRRYYHAAAKIERFGWDHRLVINGCVLTTDLCESLEAAKAKAEKQQKDYQDHLDFSAAVR